MRHEGPDVNVPLVFARALSASLGDNLRRVSLFGRTARGDRPARHFQVLIVVACGSAETSATVRRLAGRLERETRVDVVAKIVDQAHFQDRIQSEAPFWQRFVRDERVLYPERDG